MKTAIFGLVIGLLILASVCAHSLLGWPQLRDLLGSSGVDPEVVGALRVAWYFGSASMLAFSAMVLHQGLRRLRDLPVQSGPLWFISIMYLAFGTLAFVMRHLKPHFLLFVVTGLLVGCFAYLSRKESRATETD